MGLWVSPKALTIGAMIRVLGKYVRTATALVVIAAVAAASADASAGNGSIQALINEKGGGVMIANGLSNPEGQTWSWDACKPGLKECTAFAHGQIVSTGGAPPRTIFRATSSGGASALSPLWRGRVSEKGPPTVLGPVRANELVTPVPGTWQGGWARGVDWMQLSACVTPKGSECTTLTNLQYLKGCEDSAAVLDPVFVGRYLRVADSHLGPDPGFRDYGVSTPYGWPVWRRTQQLSVATVGKIAPASGDRTEMCGAPPLTEIPD